MKKILMLAIVMTMSCFANAVDFSDMAKDINFKNLMTSEALSKGYVEGNIPEVEPAFVPINWVFISGGKFQMGTDSLNWWGHFEDAYPVHEVTIKSFYMSKTEVTVEQYAECVDALECMPPETGDSCNWEKPRLKHHPVNCVGWFRASQYAEFKGARLPSESEWEYAATSKGKNQKYPWGNDNPTCKTTVMKENGVKGCGLNSTMPVCSKSAGNTEQGLCDMAGNVTEWVQDRYQVSYDGAPCDGSAAENTGYKRATAVLRGGSFGSDVKRLRADYRDDDYQGWGLTVYGFRLAKSY